MSKITSMSELQKYYTNYIMLRGRPCTHSALPLDEYLAVAAELFSNNISYGATAPGVPKLDQLDLHMSGGVMKVTPLSLDGRRVLDHKGVLEEYGRTLSSCVSAVAELRLGQFLYVCSTPASMTISYPTGTHIQYGQGRPPRAADSTAEPECVCSSKQLASTGHDSGCAWINWKRGNK